jgi:hypothetical protein
MDGHVADERTDVTVMHERATVKNGSTCSDAVDHIGAYWRARFDVG